MINIIIKGKHLSEITDSTTSSSISISEIKKELSDFVKRKTKGIEDDGFVFNGKKFKCRSDLRSDYESLDKRRDLLPYPFQIRTADGLYTFGSAEELHLCFDTLFYLTMACRVQEQAITIAIDNAITLDDLKIIEDNR